MPEEDSIIIDSRRHKTFFKGEHMDPTTMIDRKNSKKKIKNEIVRSMKKLGVFKPEYRRIIDIFADLCEQHDYFTKVFEESGMEYEVETGAGGTKKSPIVSTLETLRKDILAYSDRLCLTPKSLENVTAEKGKQSKLAEALNALSK